MSRLGLSVCVAVVAMLFGCTRSPQPERPAPLVNASGAIELPFSLFGRGDATITAVTEQVPGTQK